MTDEQHKQWIKDLENLRDVKNENKRLRKWLVEERLPNFCTGIECGCAERIGEARKKKRVKLHKELEQALKGQQ